MVNASNHCCVESLILSDIEHRLTNLFSDDFDNFNWLIKSLDAWLLDCYLRSLNNLRGFIDDVNLSIWLIYGLNHHGLVSHWDSRLLDFNGLNGGCCEISDWVESLIGHSCCHWNSLVLELNYRLGNHLLFCGNDSLVLNLDSWLLDINCIFNCESKVSNLDRWLRYFNSFVCYCKWSLSCIQNLNRLMNFNNCRCSCSCCSTGSHIRTLVYLCNV